MAKTPKKVHKKSVKKQAPASKPAALPLSEPVETLRPASAETTDTTEAAKTHAMPSKLQRWFSALGRFCMRSSVPEILLISTFLLSRYVQNSDFSRPSEIVLSIILFGILNTIIFYGYKFILRTNLAAHAAALSLAYALYAYTYTFPRLHHLADALTPNRWATPFTSSVVTFLVLGITFGVLAFLFNLAVMRIKKANDFPFLKIAVFAICFIFAVQIIKTVGRIWTIRHQLTYSGNHQPLEPTKPVAADKKPNMYYMVFDRYASPETLQQSFNYDNSQMLGFLDNQGFTTRQNAYSNYPFTPQSISSTMNMNYLTDLNKQFKNDAKNFQTAFPFRDILDDSTLTKTLTSQGYNYNQVSSWWDFTRNNPTADSEPNAAYRLRVLGKQYFMTDLQRDLINKSILSPWLLKGVTFGNKAALKYDRDYTPAQNFESQVAALKTIVGKAGQQKQPQFTFAHFLSPHDPYVFDKDGSTPSYSGDRTDDGADETVKYTNQLTYINTRYEDLVKTIRQQDPNAVIVIQADEGPYPKQFRGELSPTHYYDPKNLPLQQMQQKFGIMASYYLPNVDKAAVAANMTSSVDTFRYILNQYLGYNLPLLPDCQFTAGNKFTMFDFTSVGGKLRGMSEPEACKNYL